MKTKNLIIIFVIVSVLLIYSVICYNLLNKKVEINTRSIISDYFNNYYPQIDSYNFLKAISDNGIYKAFIKADKEYYTFYFEVNMQNYKLIKVEKDVPNYI